MKSAIAFSPCHITGFFEISDGSHDPLYAGSRGAGISLAQGVRTVVKASPSHSNLVMITINGKTAPSANVSHQVLDLALRHKEVREKAALLIEHSVDLAIGAGLGTSGAAALSLVLALNQALGLGMSKLEAFEVAHITEIRCKTGLGTVIAQSCGGLEIRTKPGAPGIGEVRQVPLSSEYIVVASVLGPMPTREVLSDEKSRRDINRIGGEFVDDFSKNPNAKKFMELSREFAEHVGLITPRIRKILTRTDNAGFTCSMPMFGESVFTLVKPDEVENLVKSLPADSSKSQTIISGIDYLGARLLE
ncbi:MAG: pantoate kinase [Candidatus Hodarchaeota archaeon]